MQVLYCLGVTFFGLNFIFTAHNIIVYFIGRKLGSGLVYIFYGLVCLQTLIHIFLFAILAANPDHDTFYSKDESDYKLSIDDFLEAGGETMMFAIGCIVVVQMFQLTMSLRLFLNKISIEKADCQK